MNLFKCFECNKEYVPEIIIATIDPPEDLSTIGVPKFIQSRIVKNKKFFKGEKHANAVGDKILFIDYQLHSELIKKMKLFCKNALFGLKINIIFTDDVIIGTASATAFCLKALPLPMPLTISKNPKIQKTIADEEFFQNLQRLS